MNGTAEAERVARQLERTYCKKSSNILYIACEDYNFVWSDEELHQFRQMWREGVSIPRMSVVLKRHQSEIGILVLDQIDRKYIRPRKGGALGMEA